VIAPATDELAAALSCTARACALLGRARASHYRARRPVPFGPRRGRSCPPNALSEAERAAVLAVLTSARFADKSVAQTWAVLLDEGTYLCSMSTMHRILRAAGQSRGTTPPGHPPRAGETRTAGHRADAGVELGHRAPRVAVEPCGDGRTPPPACRSGPVKLRAA
jgi:putative transposase